MVLDGCPRFAPAYPPDFLLCLVALANFMRLSLMKAAHAALGGAPCRKSGNLGRKRCFSNAFTPCTRALARSNAVCSQSRDDRRGCAPSFSAHVRLGEHGAPVQGSRLCCWPPPVLDPTRYATLCVTHYRVHRPACRWIEHCVKTGIPIYVEDAESITRSIQLHTIQHDSLPARCQVDCFLQSIDSPSYNERATPAPGDRMPWPTSPSLAHLRPILRYLSGDPDNLSLRQ
jgi:hypothetical protein